MCNWIIIGAVNTTYTKPTKHFCIPITVDAVPTEKEVHGER